MKMTTSTIIVIIGLVLMAIAVAVISIIQSKTTENSKLVSCGDGICQEEMICQGISCLQKETYETCPEDCPRDDAVDNETPAEM